MGAFRGILKGISLAATRAGGAKKCPGRLAYHKQKLDGEMLPWRVRRRFPRVVRDAEGGDSEGVDSMVVHFTWNTDRSQERRM